MKKHILAISGRPGLYSLVSQGRGMLIVESLDANKRRMPVGGRERVTSLNDVSIYTNDDDVPLLEVFEHIRKKEGGNVSSLNIKTASDGELASYMAEILPDYDRDRVYKTDIKKLIGWYNILIQNGVSDFVEKEEEKQVDEPTGDVQETDSNL